MFSFVNIAHQRKILNTETREFVEWDASYPFDGRGRTGRTWRFTSPARDTVECVEANADRIIGWDSATNRPTMDGGRSFENYAADGCPVPAPYKAPVAPDDFARRARRTASDDRRRV